MAEQPTFDPTTSSTDIQSSSAPGSSPSANGSASSVQNAKDTIVATAQSAMTSIQNNDTVQNLSNGPVAQNVKAEASKTSSEVQNVFNSRKTPNAETATGQSLTHYHSMFYNILSWENPRASALAFGLTLTFIFCARYLPIIRWFFKMSYIILGVTALLELAGSALFNDGLTSKVRPRKYWTIPRASLEACLDDVEQLINFFVIESQRILFAENVFVTVAAFASALLSYWLIKIVPIWGLTVLSTIVIYTGPLIYIKNQKAIDGFLKDSSDMVSAQTNQLKDITAQKAGNATATVKSYAGEYTSKAQEYMNARKPSGPYTNGSATKTENPPAYSSTDLPTAPTSDPVKSEPLAPDAVPQVAQ